MVTHGGYDVFPDSSPKFGSSKVTSGNRQNTGKDRAEMTVQRQSRDYQARTGMGPSACAAITGSPFPQPSPSVPSPPAAEA